MKRPTILVLIFLVATVTVQTGRAQQTRPRRVGQTPPAQPRTQQTQSPQQSATSANEATDASQSPRPSRPPVLGGANRDPNEQKPAGTSSKDIGPEEVSEGDIVRVDTTLVSIPVSVMDRDGKFIPNLHKEDFRIWEDGTEQQVAYFASTEKPFTVALMIDTSGSTREKLRDIQEAAIAFVDQLRPDDRVTVVSFSDRIRQEIPPTSDHNALRNAILQTRPGDGTKLYEAVDKVINDYLRGVEGRKAIVLFTDGVDTTSKRASYESTVREAEELDALIYPVEYDTYQDLNRGVPSWPGGGRRGTSPLDILIQIMTGGGVTAGGGGGRPPIGSTKAEYERGDRYLHDLARVTGARLYNADTNQNLDYAFRMVAEELRRQYSLGYYPNRKPQPGERRSIKVRVKRPELVVRTRDSYIFRPGANRSAQTGSQNQQQKPVLKKELRGSLK